MEQQNEQGRSNSRQSQKFLFNLQHIGKRTGKYLKSANSSAYLRWSDSRSNEDELIVPNEQSSSFSEIPRQLDLTGAQTSSYKLPKLNTTAKTKNQPKVERTVHPNDGSALIQENEILVTKDKEVYHQKDDAKQQPQRRFSDIESSPFVVPNVSNVKNRYSMGGRKSQQFLLELLKSQKSSKQALQIEQKKRQELQICMPIQSNPKIQLIERDNKKIKDQSRHNQKKTQSKQTKTQNKQKQMSPKRKSQLAIRGSTKYMEVEQKPKTKRVTINDRGKIKLPTDSFSVQLTHIVEPQIFSRPSEQQNKKQDQRNLRQDNLKRQRPQIIEEQQEEQKQMIELQNHHIVQQTESKQDPNQTHRQNQKGNKKDKSKRKLSVQGKRRISKDSRSIKHNKDSLNSKSQQVLQDNVPGQRYKFEKKQKTFQSAKHKSRKGNRLSSQLSIIQEERVKIRKVDLISKQKQVRVEQFQSTVNSQVSRPQRTRTLPLKFYLNQRIAYNSKQEIVNTTVSVQRFMQILGYDCVHLIEGSSVKYASNSLKYKIHLKPQQKLFSIGVNEQKLNEYLKPLANFHSMWISSGRVLGNQVKIKIDNKPEKILEEKFFIQRDQRVEITNESDSKHCYVLIAIQRPSKDK